MDINTSADSTQHTEAVEDCQTDGERVPLNTIYILSIYHLPLKQQLAPMLLIDQREKLLNILFQKGKFNHFVFTKSSGNTEEIAQRDSSHSYLDYEDTVNHKNP